MGSQIGHLDFDASCTVRWGTSLENGKSTCGPAKADWWVKMRTAFGSMGTGLACTPCLEKLKMDPRVEFWELRRL